MRALIGPKIKNNARSGDYCYTEAGELVFTWNCPCSTSDCDRYSFSGAGSRQASSYAEVVDRPDVDETDLFMAFTDSLERSGASNRLHPDDVVALFEEELAMLRLLDFFPTGTILSRDPLTGDVLVPERFAGDAQILPFVPRAAA